MTKESNGGDDVSDSSHYGMRLLSGHTTCLFALTAFAGIGACKDPSDLGTQISLEYMRSAFDQHIYMRLV